MLLYALIVFLVAACGGLVLASFVLRGKLAPWVVSLLHAMLGASGLLLLGAAILTAEHIGMLPVVDVDYNDSTAALDQLKDVEETIRVRILF